MGNVHMEATQINYRGGGTKMSVEEAIKNAGNTGLAHMADIAPEFSAESAYNAGDIVYHNGGLYEFTANHAAGAWSTSDTQAATVGGKITSLEGDVANLSSAKANQITIAPEFSATSAYTAGDIVYYDGSLYEFTANHAAGAWSTGDTQAVTVGGKIESLEGNVASLSSTKANKNDIAPEFSEEVEYSAGDLVYYIGSVYRCTNSHEGEWDADDFSATTIDGELASLRSGLMNAAKAVYRDYHQIAASGNHVFTPTLEVNHAYLVTICSGNNPVWGYCGIMLKGWEPNAPVLSDIYKGTNITVSMVDTDSIQVSNTETQYNSDSEIVVIDLGRGYLA